mmetsp:Transcript_66368/g.209871  ORF Transcript_66368/g.209871 Transcript_66368/m.209871 type:complete len:202 (+) Transcript_66368:384-989(+)
MLARPTRAPGVLDYNLPGRSMFWKVYQACPRRHPARSGSPRRSLSWGTPRHSRHSPRLALSLLRVVPSSFLAASTPPRPERGLFLAQGQRTVPAPVLRLPAQQLQRVLVCLARVRVPAEYVVVAELLHLHGAQPGLGNLAEQPGQVFNLLPTEPQREGPEGHHLLQGLRHPVLDHHGDASVGRHLDDSDAPPVPCKHAAVL